MSLHVTQRKCLGTYKGPPGLHDLANHPPPPGSRTQLAHSVFVPSLGPFLSRAPLTVPLPGDTLALPTHPVGSLALSQVSAQVLLGKPWPRGANRTAHVLSLVLPPPFPLSLKSTCATF